MMYFSSVFLRLQVCFETQQIQQVGEQIGEHDNFANPLAYKLSEIQYKVECMDNFCVSFIS